MLVMTNLSMLLRVFKHKQSFVQVDTIIHSESSHHEPGSKSTTASKIMGTDTIQVVVIVAANTVWLNYRPQHQQGSAW